MEVFRYEIPDPPARRPKVSLASAEQGSRILIQQQAHADRLAGFMGKMHGHHLAEVAEIAEEFGISAEEGFEELDASGNDFLQGANSPSQSSVA